MKLQVGNIFTHQHNPRYIFRVTLIDGDNIYYASRGYADLEWKYNKDSFPFSGRRSYITIISSGKKYPQRKAV